MEEDEFEDLDEEEPLDEDKELDDIDDGLDDDDIYDDFGGNEGIAPMEKHNDLLAGLTDFSKFLRDKINGWLGLVWNEKEEKYVKSKNVVPIMNKACASWCIDYLRVYTRDNNIITNISKEEFNNMSEDIIDVLWLNIGTRAEEFGIKENGDIQRVCIELEHAATLVLMGAGDGKYNQLLQTSINRNENVSYQDQNNGMYQNQPMGIGNNDSFLKRLRKKLIGTGGYKNG